MPEHLFPRIPYDEVRSEFVRDQIRAGTFEDLNHRKYVNDLVYVEWYATGGLSPNTTGLSAAGAGRTNYRIATKYPEAYDAVREEFGEPIRAEFLQSQSERDHDPEERRRWARRHRAEWRAVAEDRSEIRTDDPGTIDRAKTLNERPRFGGHRFPALPYDDLESEFIRGEIQRGSFDDLDYRRYVNVLVYFERWTKNPGWVVSGAYPPVRPWRRAAKYPEEYDLVRRDLGAETRADLKPRSNVYYGDRDLDELARRHGRGWRRVQEGER